MTPLGLEDIGLLHLETRDPLPNHDIEPGDRLFGHLSPSEVGYVLTRL